SHKKAYVKAVRRHKYSLDTHQLLADAGYAPKVFASSIIPGNWCLVYMEYLDNHSMLHRVVLDDQEQGYLRKRIENVVKYLHNLGHVHGDLREGNILVSRLKENDFDIKLIDFEWSGTIGSVRYSHFINHKNIQWPDGAEDGKIVIKDHDIFMLNQTLQATNLL
ncbi:32322_t:CDS:1, partial [Racocetra persica]